MKPMAIVGVLPLLLFACSQPAAKMDDPPKPADQARVLHERYFTDGTAPDPRACTTDKDCIGDTITDAKGCCVVDSTPWPQSWAYHTWLSNRRMSATCKAVECPALGTPSMPEPCTTENQCVAGNCRNRCNQP